MLILVGPNAQKTAKQGPDGLRINLENGRKATAPVGMTPTFGLRGDFEITLTYELLNVADTESGFGAGINLWIGTAGSREDEASVGRFARNNQSVHVATKAAKNEQGKMVTKSFTFPTEAKKGKLRLEREGTTLRYSVSEEDGTDFTEVHKIADFTRADVRSVRVAGNTGRLPLALDFRITEFSIRGDQFIDPDAATAEATWWKWIGVNAVGLVLLLGIAVWFFRRRHRSVPLEAPSDPPRTMNDPPPKAP